MGFDCRRVSFGMPSSSLGSNPTHSHGPTRELRGGELDTNRSWPRPVMAIATFTQQILCCFVLGYQIATKRWCPVGETCQPRPQSFCAMYVFPDRSLPARVRCSHGRAMSNSRTPGSPIAVPRVRSQARDDPVPQLSGTSCGRAPDHSSSPGFSTSLYSLFVGQYRGSMPWRDGGSTRQPALYDTPKSRSPALSLLSAVCVDVVAKRHMHALALDNEQQTA